MPFVVSRWERRDTADRDEVARAAHQWVRAVAERTGVRQARVYWSGTEHVVTVVEVDSFTVMDRTPGAEEVAAEFRLADLARPLESERWTELREAERHEPGVVTLREALDMP